MEESRPGRGWGRLGIAENMEIYLTDGGTEVPRSQANCPSMTEPAFHQSPHTYPLYFNACSFSALPLTCKLKQISLWEALSPRL